MTENSNKKKNIIILGIFCVLALVLGTTLAWWSWTSSDEEKTNVVVTVDGATINYEDGEDIENNNLIPTSTKEKGIKKDITISATSNVNLNMNLEVVELADELKEESFKYEIYKDSELVNVEITNTPVIYTLYIWIDGTMDNPNDMYNKNFKFHLSASANVAKASRTIVDEIKKESKGPKTEISGLSPKVLTYKEHLIYRDKYQLNSNNLGYYYTYAEKYTFDKNKSSEWYSLTSPTSGEYSSIYGQLVGKYVVSYGGNSKEGLANSSNLNGIYKIISADASGLIEYEYLTYTGDTLDLNDTGIYEAEDDYGTSYYYRGAVTNNYVKFGEYKQDVYFGYSNNISRMYKTYDSLSECQDASNYKTNCKVGISAGTPMYFRIVRIEGNGNIKLIYDGTSAHDDNENTQDRQIGVSPFNTNYNDNAHVGYMYGEVGSSSYIDTHANNNSSDIKTYLEKWYNSNLASYSNVIAEDTIFCNDRSVSTYKNSGYTNYGYNKENTAYRWTYGPWNGNEYGNTKPQLTCPQLDDDGMSVLSATKGNHKLSAPVGLITTDEAVLAGGWNTENRNYYLYTGSSYWTMSPESFNGTIANIHIVNADSNVGAAGGQLSNNWGVKPVISLKPSTLFTGSGTQEDPYIVIE